MRYFFLLSLFCWQITPSYAEEVQSLQELQAKVEHYLYEQLSDYQDGKVTVKAENIDSRLKLAPCKKERLSVFNTAKSAPLQATTMGVRCEQEDNHWTLYVPVSVTVNKVILAAKHPLPQGTRIEAEDIYSVEMNIQQLRQGYFANSEDVIGQMTKHNLAPGAVLTPDNIQLPKIIHKGDKINITAQSDGFQVKMVGIALQEGILGQTIAVKNLTSQRTVQANIISMGEVEVLL